MQTDFVEAAAAGAVVCATGGGFGVCGVLGAQHTLGLICEGVVDCQAVNLLAVLHVFAVQASATCFNGCGDYKGVVEAEAVSLS